MWTDSIERICNQLTASDVTVDLSLKVYQLLLKSISLWRKWMELMFSLENVEM